MNWSEDLITDASMPRGAQPVGGYIMVPIGPSRGGGNQFFARDYPLFSRLLGLFDNFCISLHLVDQSVEG